MIDLTNTYNSVILKLFFLLILLIGKIAHINAFEDSQNHSDGSLYCTIGRLQMCNDDEDCVELDHQDFDKNIDNLGFGYLSGICMCRDLNYCKRKNKFLNNNDKQPKSDQLSGGDQSVHSYSNSHERLIFGILTGLLFAGFGSFLIYYYGIRYGMIRHFARRLGLTNQNTQIEDNQLLNRIEINRDDDVEITI